MCMILIRPTNKRDSQKQYIPIPYVVFCVQDLWSGQTGNVQLSQSGGYPKSTFPKLDLPTPVEPIMVKWGSGSTVLSSPIFALTLITAIDRKM